MGIECATYEIQRYNARRKVLDYFLIQNVYSSTLISTAKGQSRCKFWLIESPCNNWCGNDPCSESVYLFSWCSPLTTVRRYLLNVLFVLPCTAVLIQNFQTYVGLHVCRLVYVIISLERNIFSIERGPAEPRSGVFVGLKYQD